MKHSSGSGRESDSGGGRLTIRVKIRNHDTKNNQFKYSKDIKATIRNKPWIAKTI